MQSFKISPPRDAAVVRRHLSLAVLTFSLCPIPAPRGASAAGPARCEPQGGSQGGSFDHVHVFTRMRGGGVAPLPGASTVSKVSFSSRARYRRLAKRAARPKRSSLSSPGGASRRSLGSMQKRAQRYAPPYGAGPGPMGRSHGLKMQFGQLGEAVRDLMKAIEYGEGDLELRQLISRVRRENGYGNEMPAAIFSEWPPEPEFGEVAASDAESERRRGCVAKSLPCAGSSASRAYKEVDHRAVPLGSVELEQIELDIDSGASVTGSSEDSLSDDYDKQPAQNLLSPASVAHLIPEPMISKPTTEGVSSVDSESCDAASTSEREISAARYPEHAATARLENDFEFQQRLARWREGLPNFVRQRPAHLPSACERSDEDSEYEYLYSRDDAAEGLGSDEGPALGDSFRGELLAPRERGGSNDAGEIPCASPVPTAQRCGETERRTEQGAGDQGRQWNGRLEESIVQETEPAALFRHRVGMSVDDFARLRAASKDAHHRRLWGVPAGTSFGVLDPWVNPYYWQPMRIRRITQEEIDFIRGRGWTHSVK